MNNNLSVSVLWPSWDKLKSEEIMEETDKSEITYKCTLCPYAARCAGNLKRHVLGVHGKVKRYKCEQCNYATHLSFQLKQHVQSVHDKAKNYKCDLCEYAASQASNLRRHVRSVHDKAKNYKKEKQGGNVPRAQRAEVS